MNNPAKKILIQCLSFSGLALFICAAAELSQSIYHMALSHFELGFSYLGVTLVYALIGIFTLFLTSEIRHDEK